LLIVAAAELGTPEELADIESAVESLMDCASPCLMRIQPRMTLDEAMAILSQHEWVGVIHTEHIATDRWTITNIRWTWSGSQPSFINEDEQGFLQTELFSGNDAEIVVSIEVATTLRFDDLHTILGDTDYGHAISSTDSVGHPLVVYGADYLDSATDTSYDVETIIDCPISWLAYWDARASIGTSVYTGVDLFRSVEELRDMCNSG
jgi:hypothetical protein